jgi:hypothetical protein
MTRAMWLCDLVLARKSGERAGCAGTNTTRGERKLNPEIDSGAGTSWIVRNCALLIIESSCSIDY